MEQEAEATTNKFELRKKQFSLLLYAINQLEQSIEEEEKQENAKKERENESKKTEDTPVEDAKPTDIDVEMGETKESTDEEQREGNGSLFRCADINVVEEMIL